MYNILTHAQTHKHTWTVTASMPPDNRFNFHPGNFSRPPVQWRRLAAAEAPVLLLNSKGRRRPPWSTPPT